MNYSDLRTLAEGATGYAGGSFRDELPELSLTEAMNRLPIICQEFQRDCISMTENQNTALVEAAVSAIHYGGEPDFGPIVEASMEGIKKKIKEIFDKIKKFIRSIIDKLKLAIDKMRMSGQQLWSKYQNSAALKQDFSKADFSISGYKFTASGMIGDIGKYDSVQGIEDLINSSIKGGAALPKDFKAEIEAITRTELGGRNNNQQIKVDDVRSGEEDYKGYSDTTKGDAKAKSKIVDTLKNSSVKEREKAIVGKLTGLSLSGDDWQSALKKKLYGEKVEIKVGKDGFTVSEIGKVLGSENQLDTIREQYVHLEKTVGEYNDVLDKELDDIKSRISDNNSSEGTHTNENNALSIVSSYYTTYMGIVNQTIGVISSVKNINWQMEKARYDQAKAMLGKMLSYKAPKNNSDASDVDDADLAMFDIEL